MDDLTSEAEEGIREMMDERLIGSSDDYDSEESEQESQDSFEEKYGEKRIEILDEKLGYHTKDEPKSNRKDSKVSDNSKASSARNKKDEGKKDKKKKK